MRAPTEILGVRYFLLGVIFTRTNTRVESSHQGTPQNKNKSFSLSFPDCQSLWAGSAYITLGVASTFGLDHYILPHITQRIQAASAFQAGPHFISYPGVVPTLSRLQQIHAIPTVTSLDSAGVARLFLEHIWCHHGLPEEVISDCGPTFISNFSCELTALLGVKLTPSTSYHLQTDGQTEHVNQEIEAYLWVFVSHRQDDWADWLPLAEFAYNNKVHTATCQTPFELDTTQHPSLAVEPTRTSTIEAADAFAR